MKKAAKSMKGEQTAPIVRAVLSLGRRLRAERPAGSASLSAIAILSTLWRLGPVPAVRLAAVEQLQPQSLTRLIIGLERDGLISRTPNEADRREIIIALTRHGRKVLAADIRARGEWLERAMAATLTAAERRRLLEASEAMLKLAGYDGGSAAGDAVGGR
jgi:DNA-binding MarR family transcriptional regulator